MRRSLPAIALLMSLSLTACGGGDEDSNAAESGSPSTPASSQPEASTSEDGAASSSTEASTPADPVDAMQAWVDAYAAGDAKAACALQTDAYTKADLANAAQQGMVEKGATCEEGVAVAQQAMKAFGYDLSTAKVAEVSESGDAAEVSVTIGGEATTYGMVLVDGTWLVDSEG